jgi:hypothetical protein
MDGAKSLRNIRVAFNQIEWISCGNKFSTCQIRSYIQTEMTIQLLFQNKINAIFITGNRKKMEHMTNVMQPKMPRKHQIFVPFFEICLL